MKSSPTVPGFRRPPALVSRRRRAIERVSLALARISRGRLHGLWLGLCVALAVHVVVDQARTAQRQWGGRSTVSVAVAELAPGDPIDPESVTLLDVPFVLLPDGFVSEVPAGAVAVAPIPAGQILTEAAIAMDREGLRAGERAVTIPVPLAPPNLVIGDLVDVHAVRADPVGPTSVVPLVLGAAVANVPEGGITLAVPVEAVPALWRALATGSVELARRPPQG